MTESDKPADPALPARVSEPTPALEPMLDRLSQAVTRPEREPIRAIHHLAFTGGTEVAQALAVMPNVVLVDRVGLTPGGGGASEAESDPLLPRDLFAAARSARRPVGDLDVERSFVAAIGALHTSLCEKGQHICVASHAHSQFHTGPEICDRPAVQTLLRQVAPTLALVIVRHPRASLKALRDAGGVHYSPDTVEAYSARYHAFLDAHEGLEMLRHEDFVAAPAASMQWLCARLGLTYDPGFLDLTPKQGAADRTAEAPGAEDGADDFRGEAAESPSFSALCERLGYATNGE